MFGEIINKGFDFVTIFFVLSVGVLIAILADLADGILTAKRLGQRIHSHKLRVTTTKFMEYWRFLMVAFVLDLIGLFVEWRFGVYPLPFACMVIGVGLVVVEIKSMFEHARKRKSSVTDVTAILGQVIEAADEKDARKALNAIKNYIESKNDIKLND